MAKPLSYFLLAIVGLSVLASATPSLVALLHAVLPVILVLGAVAGVLRLVFFHTRRW